MSARARCFTAALIALAVMIVVAASQKREEPPRHLFRLVLGLKDTKPDDWSGEVEVEGGQVIALTGWRFEEKDAVDGVRGWKCRTHNNIAPDERVPLTLASGKTPVALKQPWPNGVTLTVRGANPTLTIKLKAGDIKFKAEAIFLGEAKTFLDEQVHVERMPEPLCITTAAYDWPAWWKASGKSRKPT
jgi:hypothetical protein